MIRWTGVLQEDRNRFMLLLEYAQSIYLPYWYLYLPYVNGILRPAIRTPQSLKAVLRERAPRSRLD